MMKLSKVGIDTLKNLATINQGMIFKPGSVLKTMNVMKNTFAVAHIPDVFPVEFAIYDLNEFLIAYSLSQDCDIEFKETMMLFSQGGEQTEYFYSSPSVVVSPGDKNITLPSTDKKFLLSKEVFDKIMKVSAALKLKDIEIDSSGIRVLNKNSVGNRHHIKLPIECFNSTEDTIATLKVENLKLMPGDYDVAICQKGLARFSSRSEEYKVEYHIALEAN